MAEPNSSYHTLTIKDTLTALNTKETGLSNHEAEQRLHQYGLNEIKKEKGISPLKIFLQQFTSPLVWILLAALVIAFVLDEDVNAIIIAVIVIINAILGFVQEYKAEKAIEALQKLASLTATVIRNGKEIKILSKQLVPGDLIVLETGDKVPADARLLEVHTFQTQEGSLTGESLPVTKTVEPLNQKTPLAERTNMIYSSTIVTNGRARAVITKTGMSTEVGKIAKLIQEAQEEITPLQKKLQGLGKYLTIAVVIIAVIIFFAGLLSGQTMSVMFLTAIALAVAAIPEGLPAVITICLALGIQRMIKKNALVRKLHSIETLGSVTTICTDKTGTLTHNQMTVTKLWTNHLVYEVTGSGYEPRGNFLLDKETVNPKSLQQLLIVGLLCNNAKFFGKLNRREVIGDPTEAALIVSAEKAGINVEELNRKFTRTDEVAFTSERKMMTTVHGRVSYTKGAPDLVLNRCSRILIDGKVQRLEREQVNEILNQNELFARDALRVLGFAYKENTTIVDAERDMIFVGLQAMIDPPRNGVKEAIKKCHDAGIKVIMITGDQLATAEAIADNLGITGDAITGQQLDEIKNLEKEIKHIGIFARVNPEHKLKIISALKKNGHIVAMTGDGVNDAPALKKADIGIAMGITGTDVAKEASDMILTDDHFTSIVNAVEEGRGIFDNIRKFVNYLLSCNLGEITVIFFASIYASLAGGNIFLPLTAIQILWLNLITDGLPATALSLDKPSPEIMKRKPRLPSESILSKELRTDIILFGVLTGLASFGLFLLYLGTGEAKVQTIVFTSLVLFELVRLQTIHSEHKLKLLSNKFLVGAVCISVLLQLAVIYTPLNSWFKTAPLGWTDWGVLVVASLVLMGVYKVVSYLVKGRKDKKK